MLALEKLMSTRKSDQFNLGNGLGYSVHQVIDCAAEITGREIPVKIEARRSGDPATLVADATRAKQELGWVPRSSALETIIESAWNWEQSFFSH
jgi:UDP-glucose 4-epimerase